ncbi:hypothetical protein ANN_19253 [Periplaneta americana]|uniref:Reverse transcriptase domain-containing protein n=1 Tax=Periplaneta americana TaxID=6978 RepID=A0ABQ8S9C1_PERAM|nr:hypothetical protein ANN_19253 [Periplaneta americana]
MQASTIEPVNEEIPEPNKPNTVIPEKGAAASGSQDSVESLPANAATLAPKLQVSLCEISPIRNNISLGRSANKAQKMLVITSSPYKERLEEVKSKQLKGEVLKILDRRSQLKPNSRILQMVQRVVLFGFEYTFCGSTCQHNTPINPEDMNVLSLHIVIFPVTITGLASRFGTEDLSSAKVNLQSRQIGDEAINLIMEALETFKFEDTEELIFDEPVPIKNAETPSSISAEERDMSDFQPSPEKLQRYEWIPLDTKIKVVNLANWSLNKLLHQGSRLLKRKGLLALWRRDIETGGTRYDKMVMIDKLAYDRFVEARERPFVIPLISFGFFVRLHRKLQLGRCLRNDTFVHCTLRNNIFGKTLPKVFLCTQELGDSSFPNEELLEGIIEQNPTLKQCQADSNEHVILRFMKHSRNGQSQFAVLEVTPKCYRSMMSLGKLYIGYMRCPVRDHIHVNVHKSLIPTQEIIHTTGLNSQLSNNEIKLLCVQEPNYRKNRISGFGIHNFVHSYKNGSDDLRDKRLLILGDINAKHHAWGSPINDWKGIQFHDFCCANNLTILNKGNKPTYRRNNCASFLDVSVCSDRLLQLISDWAVSDTATMSDHELIIIRIQSASCNSNFSGVTRKYRTKNVKWDHFKISAKKKLQPISSKINNIVSSEVLNVTIENLTNDIISLCEKHLPKKSQTVVKNYWWSTELTILRKRVLASYRRFRRCRCDELRRKYKDSYDIIREEYKNKIIHAKISTWKEFCSTQTSRNPWSVVYKICRQPENFNRTLTTVKTDDGYTINAHETATHLINNFFPDDTQDLNFHKHVQYLTELTPRTGDEREFTYEEVNSVINKLDDKKTPGLDALSANIVKNVHNCCPDLFVNIFNKCLELHTFPDHWKIAAVRIISKPHCTDKLTASAFRPICLLPVMGKVFEKLIIDRIMYHMHSNNLLNTNQYGFIPQKSTEDAVLNVVNWAKEVLANKQIGLLISLDIKGAFDNAWWPMILLQLKRKECPRNLYKLIKNYFCNRKAQLTLGLKTVSKHINKRCPQGSVCSPGLWVILYDGLLQIDLPVNCNIIAYVDDALILIKGENIQTITEKANSTLKIVSKWGINNKLHFNPHKTTAMLVTKKKNVDVPLIKFNSEYIQTVMVNLELILNDSKLRLEKNRCARVEIFSRLNIYCLDVLYFTCKDNTLLSML